MTGSRAVATTAATMVRALVLAALLMAACTPSGPERPSYALIVVDTLRADAVSAYGAVSGTTPYVDGLARSGQLYLRAYADAPWTIPSHASLLSGQAVWRHGTGVAGRVVVSQGWASVATRLKEAGYETAGFSENPLVSSEFGLDRGFDRFEAPTVAELVSGRAQTFDAAARAIGWLDARESDGPFFLFVNLMHPHEPFELRDDNPFLPAGVTDDDARRSLAEHARAICRDLPDRAHLDILRGLYLGDVAAADDAIARLHGRLTRDDKARPLVTIVTSDHGEHLGEHRLLDHQFSVADVLLHVPLVVHGMPHRAPAIVDDPVALVDVAPSLLAWTGLPLPTDLDGRPLPATAAYGDGGEARVLGAVYSEWRGLQPDDWPAGVPPLWSPTAFGGTPPRSACGDDARVFGEMVAVRRHPHKLVWFERYPPMLYDLNTDPSEIEDRAREDASTTARLRADVDPIVEQLEAHRDDAHRRTSDDALTALRALGYID